MAWSNSLNVDQEIEENLTDVFPCRIISLPFFDTCGMRTCYCGRQSASLICSATICRTPLGKQITSCRTSNERRSHRSFIPIVVKEGLQWCCEWLQWQELLARPRSRRLTSMRVNWFVVHTTTLRLLLCALHNRLIEQNQDVRDRSTSIRLRNPGDFHVKRHIDCLFEPIGQSLPIEICLNAILDIYYCIHDVRSPRQWEPLLAPIILMFLSAVRIRTVVIELFAFLPMNSPTWHQRKPCDAYQQTAYSSVVWDCSVKTESLSLWTGSERERESHLVRFCQMSVILSLIGLERNAPMNNSD